MSDGHKTRICLEEYKSSIKCIEQNYEDKDEKCATAFETYRQCKKRETKARHLKNNGGEEQTFFPSWMYPGNNK